MFRETNAVPVVAAPDYVAPLTNASAGRRPASSAARDFFRWAGGLCCDEQKIVGECCAEYLIAAHEGRLDRAHYDLTLVGLPDGVGWARASILRDVVFGFVAAGGLCALIEGCADGGGCGK